MSSSKSHDLAILWCLKGQATYNIISAPRPSFSPNSVFFFSPLEPVRNTKSEHINDWKPITDNLSLTYDFILLSLQGQTDNRNQRFSTVFLANPHGSVSFYFGSPHGQC